MEGASGNASRALRRNLTYHVMFAKSVLGQKITRVNDRGLETDYYIERVYITDPKGVATTRPQTLLGNNIRTVVTYSESNSHNGIPVRHYYAFNQSSTFAPFDDVVMRNWLLTIGITVAKNARPADGQLGFDQYGIFMDSNLIPIPEDTFVRPSYDVEPLPMDDSDDLVGKTIKLTI